MNKHSVASGLGLSSLLVVFVSLCMILLSVLSLTNANSNMKTAKNYQKSVNDYYNACFEADKICYDLVSLIDNNDQNELKKYLNLYKVDLSNNEISYKINIDNNKYLFVKINLDGEVKQYQLIEVDDADYEKKGFDY